MKSSWVTTFAVGGVLAVLTLFLGLQYNWLSRASEAERERMQRRVEADTKNFADDLNREVQAAYFNFQTDSESWEKHDWSSFNERYDFWKGKTQYPELISSFVFLPNAGGEVLRYDPAARAFIPAGGLSPELQAARAKLDTENGAGNDLFIEGGTVLVMPVHRAQKQFERIFIRRTDPGVPSIVNIPGRGSPIAMPERLGTLLIALDRSVISGRLLPDLTAKYFPEGNYKVSVVDSAQNPVYASAGDIAAPDAHLGVLSLSPDNMIFFGERAMLSKREGEQKQGVVVGEHIESRTFTHTESSPAGERTGKVTVELKRSPDAPPGGAMRTRTSVFAGTGGEPWTLNVQHAAGSIDAFTRGEFRRNFFIGLGLYLLLAGAIVAIILSALRSKRFAQRQIDFVSSVSHEFRTPLAVIYSASENLADGVANDREQVTRYGNLIKGEGRKLSAMVEQILQFAGARSGKRKYNFSLVEPSELIAAAVTECTTMLEENGFQLETSIADDLRPVKADAVAISTALQNLISNSVKYSNDSRWIGLSASNGGGTLKLAVEDRGIGIASRDLKDVFEPFYRAPNVVDAQIHGNGLGLALVKEITEAHGGKVAAVSEAGKGSKFTIELPA